MHLKLGLWRRSLTEELSEASIASIMANLRAATEHGPAWGKVRCRGDEGGGDSRKWGRGSGSVRGSVQRLSRLAATPQQLVSMPHLPT